MRGDESLNVRVPLYIRAAARTRAEKPLLKGQHPLGLEIGADQARNVIVQCHPLCGGLLAIDRL